MVRYSAARSCNMALYTVILLKYTAVLYRKVRQSALLYASIKLHRLHNKVDGGW